MIRPVHALGLALLALSAAAAPALLVAADPHTATGSGAVARGDRLAFDRLAGLDPAREALVIVAPEVGYAPEEVQLVRAFLRQGGHVLVAGDGGADAELLDQLGAGLRSTRARLFTPAFEGRPDHVLAERVVEAEPMPPALVLTRPVALEGGEPLYLTPGLTWHDVNDDGRPALDEPLARAVVAARAAFGDGLLVVVGDPDALLAPGEARETFLDLVRAGDRRLVWDEAHRRMSDPLGLDALLAARQTWGATIAILMLAFLVGALVVLGPRLRDAATARRATVRPEGPDERILREALAELENA